MELLFMLIVYVLTNYTHLMKKAQFFGVERRIIYDFWGT